MWFQSLMVNRPFKGGVTYRNHVTSVIVRSSVIVSHFNLLKNKNLFFTMFAQSDSVLIQSSSLMSSTWL